MKKIIAIILLILAGILYGLLFLRPNSQQQTGKKITPSATTQPIPTAEISRDVLFVPYWSTDSLTPGFQTYVYFGITPDASGIDTKDPGYAGLPLFTTLTQGSRTLLAIRMMPGATTEKILQEKSLQEAVVQDSMGLAKRYGFDGVVLDLEYSGLAFPSVTKFITDFSVYFATQVKANNLSFYQTLFGDSFYLARPYDIAAIGKASDGIFVLSYDFHKANGTPGPNFPLQSMPDADYTFSDMVTDFSKKVAKDKLTIVFGMFGYDWTIDDKGRQTKSATSLSDADIRATFLAKCLFKNCVMKRNKTTQEPFVTYTDTNGENHIVWWEDTQSIVPKEQVLQKNGISHVGFWANGYF